MRLKPSQIDVSTRAGFDLLLELPEACDNGRKYSRRMTLRHAWERIGTCAGLPRPVGWGQFCDAVLMLWFLRKIGFQSTVCALKVLARRNKDDLATRLNTPRYDDDVLISCEDLRAVFPLGNVLAAAQRTLNRLERRPDNRMRVREWRRKNKKRRKQRHGRNRT